MSAYIGCSKNLKDLKDATNLLFVEPSSLWILTRFPVCGAILVEGQWWEKGALFICPGNKFPSFSEGIRSPLVLGLRTDFRRGAGAGTSGEERKNGEREIEWGEREGERQRRDGEIPIPGTSVPVLCKEGNMVQALGVWV